MKKVILFMGYLVGISASAQSPTFVWAKGIGANGYDEGSSVIVDTSGNVYTAGYFGGTVDFDPGPAIFNLTSAGLSDIFISKFDAAGNFVWAKSMGGTSDDIATTITIDVSGNIYTSGYFWGTSDFDPGVTTFNLTSGGNEDIF